METCINCAVLLTMCLNMSPLLAGSQSQKTANKEKLINFTVIEGNKFPLVLGNLVAHFNLTNQFRSITDNFNGKEPGNRTVSIPSIDFITNAVRLSTQHSTFSDTVPRLRLFPSKQWAEKYVNINFKSPLIQELVVIQSMDREAMCQLMTYGKNTTASPNTCTCDPRVCSMSNVPQDYKQPKRPYCEFQFTVTVYPLQQEVTIHTVRIRLRDVNDNAPVFQPSSYFHWLVKESAPIGFRRLLPPAVDYDLCHNSHISYKLTIPSGHKQSDLEWFHLRSRDQSHDHLSLMIAKSLDREFRSSFQFLLLAIDGHQFRQDNIHRLTGTLTISIEVEDVNDCSPVFVQHKQPVELALRQSCDLSEDNKMAAESITLKVKENSPPGSMVHRFQAVDGDITHNSSVMYQIGSVLYPLTHMVSAFVHVFAH